MQTHKDFRNRRATFPHATVVDIDPEDPSQVLEENLEPIDDDTAIEHPEDTGDLYGVHVSPAGDRALSAPDDRDSFVDADLGVNWFEALGQHSTESGPVPEHEVTVIDDSDPHDEHPPTDFRDRPKADRGSGGRGGL
jgi:hypothetical protein